MAFPHPTGLQASEVAFLCEMELITIIPRQRLERLDLLGGPTPSLLPPQRTTLPLWLALLLKRQKRANIFPPSWLDPISLREILDLEITHFQDSFSPPIPLPPIQSSKQTSYDGTTFYTSTPFTSSNTNTNTTTNTTTKNTNTSQGTNNNTALPYHWFELSEMLLDAASDDLTDPDSIRGLLRDIREVRLAKMRKGVEVLGGDGDGVRLDGVGAMEVAESRGFIVGVMDGLRRIGSSREVARREREEEEEDDDEGTGGGDEEDEDEDML